MAIDNQSWNRQCLVYHKILWHYDYVIRLTKFKLNPRDIFDLLFFTLPSCKSFASHPTISNFISHYDFRRVWSPTATTAPIRLKYKPALSQVMTLSAPVDPGEKQRPQAWAVHRLGRHTPLTAATTWWILQAGSASATCVTSCAIQITHTDRARSSSESQSHARRVSQPNNGKSKRKESTKQLIISFLMSLAPGWEVLFEYVIQ